MFLAILDLTPLLLANFRFSWIVFLQFFSCFLDFLDIWALYPAVLTNSDFRADDVPGNLDFSTPFHLILSIFKLFFIKGLLKIGQWN